MKKIGISKSDQLNTKRYRKRKCKTCSTWFRPENEGQPICMKAECAIPFAREVIAKEKRKAATESKQNTIAKLKKRAEASCNPYILKRDQGYPCISCGYIWATPNSGRAQHAGHYKSVGERPDIRYNEDNIHLQCDQCNMFKGGGLHPGYRPNLIKRIGIDKVEALESNNVPRKYCEDDLREIAKHYKYKKEQII